MRCPPLHVGDLVRLQGTDIVGVIVSELRTGVYVLHVFADNVIYTFPRGMIQKFETDKKCP